MLDILSCYYQNSVQPRMNEHIQNKFFYYHYSTPTRSLIKSLVNCYTLHSHSSSVVTFCFWRTSNVLDTAIDTAIPSVCLSVCHTSNLCLNGSKSRYGLHRAMQWCLRIVVRVVGPSVTLCTQNELNSGKSTIKSLLVGYHNVPLLGSD